VSRFQAERLLLGCTASSAVVVAGDASAACQVVAQTTAEPPPTASVAALCAALGELKPARPAAGARRTELHVTVDDGLVRSYVVTPPNGARDLQELRAAAAARFAVLYGESAEPWLLAADWQASAPFIASALPRQLCRQLDSLARTNRWQLGSVCPALVRSWNREPLAVPDDGWLIVGFGLTLTLAHTCNAQPVALRTERLPAAPGLAELATLLEQERLRTPLPAEAHVRQRLSWTGAADWLPQAATVAGLASRTDAHDSRTSNFASLSDDCRVAVQLALAGGQR